MDEKTKERWMDFEPKFTPAPKPVKKEKPKKGKK
jgi:hypothetical protein